MGLYIKGMEMPTRCEDCFCFRHNAEYDYAYCNISSVNVLGHGNARLNNCPLVPVPPHGDLIERKTAYDSLLNGMVMTGYQSMALDCISDFYVPTIIPASEEG